jgi:hypothetical protein
MNFIERFPKKNLKYHVSLKKELSIELFLADRRAYSQADRTKLIV